MDRNSPRWHQITPSEFAWEQEALGIYPLVDLRGSRANRVLATSLGDAADPRATDNVTIRLTGADAPAGLMDRLRRHETPTIDDVPDDLVRGLKFSACLPDDLARRVVASRVLDHGAANRVIEEPIRAS